MCMTACVVYVAAFVFWLEPIYSTLQSENLNWGALMMITLTVLGLSLLLVGTTKLEVSDKWVTVLKVAASANAMATVFTIAAAISDNDPGGYLIGGLLPIVVIGFHLIITVSIPVIVLTVRARGGHHLAA